MGYWGLAIMGCACVGIAFLIWKFEEVKKIAMFLAGGLLASIGIIMIGMIWIPHLSAWWVLIIEVVIIAIVIIKGKYVD